MALMSESKVAAAGGSPVVITVNDYGYYASQSGLVHTIYAKVTSYINT